MFGTTALNSSKSFSPVHQQFFAHNNGDNNNNNKNNKVATWMLVDTGKDDAAMLVQSMAHREKFNIQGVIACSGNVALKRTLNNTKYVIDQCGERVPIFEGMRHPKDGQIELSAAVVHGNSGLADLDEKEIANDVRDIAHEQLVPHELAKCILAHPDLCLLLCTAPLQDLYEILKALVVELTSQSEYAHVLLKTKRNYSAVEELGNRE
jgi:hypothetical protein